MIRPLLFAIISTCAIFSSCSTNTVKQTKIQSDVQPIVQKPWLNEKLPANAYSYIRIPNGWSFFSASDDSFAIAQGNDAHVTQIKQLQTALANILKQELPLQIKPLVDLLTTRLASPLEVIVYPVEGSPFPYLLAAAQLNYDNAEQLNPLLNEITNAASEIEVKRYFDESGYATLQVGSVDIILQYNNQSLIIFSGLGVSSRLMAEQLVQLKYNDNKEFLAFEQKVDTSGSGALIWINTASVIPMATAFAPEQTQELTDLGLTDISSLAFGIGSANGKGRLRVALSVDESSELFARASTQNNQPDFKTVGQPSLVTTLSLPNKDQINGNSQHYLMTKPEILNAYNEALKELNLVNSKPLEYFDNFGHITIYKDDIGFFAAQHIRNKDSYANYMIETLASLNELASSSNNLTDTLKDSDLEFLKQFVQGIQVSSRTYANQEIYHLMIPGIMYSSVMKQLEENVPLPFLIQLISGGNNHLYWIIEDNYVVYASVPQLLMERIRNKKTDSIEQWRAANGLTQQDSLIAISGQFDGGKPKLYNEYLQFLTVLADSLNAQFDIFAFPTASELALDDPGLASIQLDVSRTGIALELTYEKTPLDALLMADSGGMATIATIGILAAVAIPSYQDYTVRAQVSKIYSKSFDIQGDIKNYYKTKHAFPNTNELESFETTIEDEHVYSVEIEPDTGVISINLYNNRTLSGESIWLSPVENGADDIYFTCESSLANKYLPTACKY